MASPLAATSAAVSVVLLALLAVSASAAPPAVDAGGVAPETPFEIQPSVYEAATRQRDQYLRSNPSALAQWRAHRAALRQLEADGLLAQERDYQFAATEGLDLHLLRGGRARPGEAGLRADGRRRLLQTTASSTAGTRLLGLGAPQLTGQVSPAAVNSSLYRYDSVSPPSSVDWRSTAAMTPVQRQLLCESCWAVAVADAVSIMWGLSLGLGSLPSGSQSNSFQLSVQQLLDCVQANTGCLGGWPEWALSYVVYNGGLANAANYPYIAKSSSCNLALSLQLGGGAQITGWERTPINSAAALRKAVANQPVIAFLSASSADFQLYRGGIYGLNGTAGCTASIDHVVVIVGYGTDPVAGPFWILKNSWGPDWGEGGYMRMAMVDGPGLCGITSTPGLFPVYFPAQKVIVPFASFFGPLGTFAATTSSSNSLAVASVSVVSTTGGTTTTTTTSTTTTTTTLAMSANATATSTSVSVTSVIKLTPNPCAVSFPPPCGAGQCYAQTLSNGAVTARCICPPGFVEAQTGLQAKCVNANPCGVNPNPCLTGACTNNLDGTYSCACTNGTVIGSRTDGSQTCVAGSGFGLPTYTAITGDTCTSIATAFGLPLATLQLNNPGLNCSLSLMAGLIVAVGTDSISSGCAKSYTCVAGDTLNTIAANTGLAPSALFALNPALSPARPLVTGQRICVANVSATATATAARTAVVAAAACGRSYAILPGQDTCAWVTATYGISLASFLSMNPGVSCSDPLPASVVVCVALNITVAPTQASTCTQYYRVQQGDNCPVIWNSANLTESQFFVLNPGIQCDLHYLLVGQQVCVAGPAAATSANVIPYTTGANDTLPILAKMFQARCGSSATTAAICAANAAVLPSCDGRLPPGVPLLVPCAWPVGRSCGCPNDGVAVCGADGQWYPNYCTAVCNYATPANAYTNGGCSDLQLACAGHSCFGTPDWIEVGFPITCPWPTWWPIDYAWWGTDVCSFYRGACQSCCTGSYNNFNQGYPSASFYACYNACKGHVNYGC